jgi:large subunit ribosomal protein L3
MAKNKLGILGTKLGMTQVFSEEGYRIPVTAVKAGPVVVLGKRTVDKHGYSAIQIGFEDKAPRLVNRPETGVFAKLKVAPKRFVREIRVAPADLDQYEDGKELAAGDLFGAGSFVDVTGTSKGKGYQGVMKRHNFPGFRATHGTHEFFRHGGSIGCRLTPGRVHRGKRMSGHMGDERVTVQSLAVYKVLPEDNIILIRGAVPGGKNGLLELRQAIKRTGTWKPRSEVPAEQAPKNPMKASKAGTGAAKPKATGAKPAAKK